MSESASQGPAVLGPDRVCIVTQALYPFLVGGGAIVAHQLANELARRGLAVTMHNVDYRRPPQAKDTPERLYDLHMHRFPRMPWDGIGTAGNPFAWRMYAAVRHDPATVAHLQSHLFFTSLFGALGARRSGKAIVLSVHGVRAARSPFVNFLQEVWLRTTSRWLFRRSQRVVCLTDEDRVEVLRYGADPRRTVTLFNTYDDDAFFPAAGKGGSPGPVAPEALWVGRHVEEKGVRYLVQAWAKVHAALPEARLVLIGDGPLRAETEREVARQGLSDSVRFETFQPRAAVGEAMRSCQVFVLPSVREGFPLAVVEAMACGKPVVTTQGLATIVGAGGSVVPAKDADALAGALVDYLQNPARAARVGGQALQRARAEFGLERLTDAHLRIYAEALAEVRRHPRRPHGAGPADGGSPA